MTKKAYLVFGITGYDGEKTWPVRIFLNNEEKAKSFMEKASALAKNLMEEWDNDMDDIQYQEYCKYDPDLLDNHIANTTYDYSEVPLME